MKKNQKENQLKHWQGLQKRNPLEVMEAIPYKTKGSRYGACGVRIDGTPEFIDAVLSCLKELIDGESITTRLELARSTVDGSGLGKGFGNAAKDAECCYIRLHERGREGMMLQAYTRSVRQPQLV